MYVGPRSNVGHAATTSPQLCNNMEPRGPPEGGWGVRELGTRGLVSIRLNTGGVIQEKEKKLINNEFDSSLDRERGILRS